MVLKILGFAKQTHTKEIQPPKKEPCDILISLGGLHIVAIGTTPQTILDWLKSASCHIVETHPDRPQLVGKNLSTAQRNKKLQISEKAILTGIPWMGNVQYRLGLG